MKKILIILSLYFKEDLKKMKIAYLLLAHNTPNHMRRLIDALSTDAATFFIHIDKKSDIEEYFYLKKENVYFTKKRIAVYWGHFSQVEAILILMKTAFFSKVKYDRFVLLSGADYPIKSTAYIEAFFQDNKDKEYIVIKHQEKLARHLENYQPLPKYKQQIRFLRKILIKINIIPEKRNYKKHLGKLTPYGGATWWGLTCKAIEYILRFVDSNPKLMKYFKNIVCPDEILFHTILGNSSFKEKSEGGLTYVDWSRGESNPAYITRNHLKIFQNPQLFSQNLLDSTAEQKLFARKFCDDSHQLIEILNNQIEMSKF